MSDKKAIQECYPAEYDVCYGCGSHNPAGLQIKSFEREGGETFCRFVPRSDHTAFAGFLFGGVIASVVDCHGTATAAAAAARAEGREIGSQPPLRFVTASLKVDFIKPTPLGEIEVRAKVTEIKGRKVIVAATVHAQGEITCKGEIVCVKLPDSMKPK